MEGITMSLLCGTFILEKKHVWPLRIKSMKCQRLKKYSSPNMNKRSMKDERGNGFIKSKHSHAKICILKKIGCKLIQFRFSTVFFSLFRGMSCAMAYDACLIRCTCLINSLKIVYNVENVIEWYIHALVHGYLISRKRVRPEMLRKLAFLC